MLTATLLVVLGIALWLCILIVMTVIGVRRGDFKLPWRSLLLRLRRRREDG
ncbi:MAG: hypothetical protein HY709_05610 [Candidatus Latescibacteria bacterium]|nr:hypothetical protein [Candidatus Latescibacterota bacterium]